MDPADMTDEERAALMRRAFAALDATSDAAIRVRERKQARLRGDFGPRVSEPPKPVPPPVRRPERSGRDWKAEADFFTAAAAVDQKIAALEARLIAGMGEVIAQERADTAAAIAAVREEVRQAVAKDGADNAARLKESLDELSRLVRSLEVSDGGLLRRIQFDRYLPN